MLLITHFKFQYIELFKGIENDQQQKSPFWKKDLDWKAILNKV